MVNAHRARSLYDVLNVTPRAEPVVIEAAYRALMKKYHPDHGAGAPLSCDASEINGAFAILRDPQQRAAYDHQIWLKQQKPMLVPLQPRFQPQPRRSRASTIGACMVAIGIGTGLGLWLSGTASIATPSVRPVMAVTASLPAPVDAVALSGDEQTADFLSLHSRPGQIMDVPPPAEPQAVGKASATPGAEAPKRALRRASPQRVQRPAPAAQEAPAPVQTAPAEPEEIVY